MVIDVSGAGMNGFHELKRKLIQLFAQIANLHIGTPLEKIKHRVKMLSFMKIEKSVCKKSWVFRLRLVLVQE